MIRLARERGVTVILVAVPSPGIALSPPPFYPEIAAEMGLPIEEEVLTKVLSDGSLKSDYIHPNAAGYRKLAGGDCGPPEKERCGGVETPCREGKEGSEKRGRRNDRRRMTRGDLLMISCCLFH